MTHEEHLDVIEYICRVTKKRIPVVAGTGSNCTETAVYLSAEAEKRGADGLLLVSPYYNKATQKGLMAHFTAVADAVKIPVILYNIPGRTGVTIKPETIAALCRDVDNIVGVKEASGNFSAIATLMSCLTARWICTQATMTRLCPFSPWEQGCYLRAVQCGAALHP